jgi:hypothetical protein
MRSARAAVALSGVTLVLILGCTNRSDSSQPAQVVDSDNAVGITIQAGSGSPQLQMKATFTAGVEPGPHIPPLATMIASARASCFSANVAEGASATADLDVSGKQVHVLSHNAWGECFAKVIDGHAIDDAATYKVALQLIVGPHA